MLHSMIRSLCLLLAMALVPHVGVAEYYRFSAGAKASTTTSKVVLSDTEVLHVVILEPLHDAILIFGVNFYRPRTRVTLEVVIQHIDGTIEEHTREARMRQGDWSDYLKDENGEWLRFDLEPGDRVTLTFRFKKRPKINSTWGYRAYGLVSGLHNPGGSRSASRNPSGTAPPGRVPPHHTEEIPGFRWNLGAGVAWSPGDGYPRRHPKRAKSHFVVSKEMPAAEACVSYSAPSWDQVGRFRSKTRQIRQGVVIRKFKFRRRPDRSPFSFCRSTPIELLVGDVFKTRYRFKGFPDTVDFGASLGFETVE